MNRAFREIDIWGTVIVVEVASKNQSAELLESAIDSAQSFFVKIDQLLSTYKIDSEVSRLRRGEISIGDCSPEVQEVWLGSLDARELTNKSNGKLVLYVALAITTTTAAIPTKAKI